MAKLTRKLIQKNEMLGLEDSEIVAINALMRAAAVFPGRNGARSSISIERCANCGRYLFTVRIGPADDNPPRWWAEINAHNITRAVSECVRMFAEANNREAANEPFAKVAADLKFNQFPKNGEWACGGLIGRLVSKPSETESIDLYVLAAEDLPADALEAARRLGGIVGMEPQA